MAAGAWTIYSQAVLEMGKGSFDLATDTYVCVLTTNSYAPAVNTDSTWANVSADELATGGGYTQGGVVLASQTWTTASGTATFDTANPSWASFTATCRYAVIVRRAGASLASTDLLMAYCDLGGGSPITGGGGTLTINVGSAIFTETHTP